jgi:hypothetical protein
MTTKKVFSVDPEIRWRDLIALEIPNPELKKRVEIFLNLLEKSAFSYQFNDAATGQSEERFFSGQDLLKRMADVRKNFGVWLEEHQGSKIAEFFSETPLLKAESL